MPVTATPIRPAIGLEVTGLSGAELVDRKVADECLAALEGRGVVIYRRANVDDDQLVAFSRMLGEVLMVPNGALPTHPEVAPVTRDRSKDQMAAYREGTFFWHIDGANDLVPNKATLLTARQVSADDEGDTEFANLYAAYEALSDEDKARYEQLRVVHSFAATQRLANPDANEKVRASWDLVPTREHPLVWTRKDGRKSLLVGATADHVVGMDPDESRQLLDQLLDWATQPDFVVRHHWTIGDLVIWDNTGILHRALPYSSDSPRLMHRTTVAGEEAIA